MPNRGAVVTTWQDVYRRALGWLEQMPSVFAWLVGFSVFAFVGSLVVLPVVIARMDANYFVGERREKGRRSHPVIHALFVILRNAAGIVFIVAGIAMLVLPGQGLLSILVGASLADFPGKRRLELTLVRQRRVLAALNWIRRKAKAPPLNVSQS